MKLSRLYRPNDRRFWLMILLNVLSAILAWVLRTYPLVPLASRSRWFIRPNTRHAPWDR